MTANPHHPTHDSAESPESRTGTRRERLRGIVPAGPFSR